LETEPTFLEEHMFAARHNCSHGMLFQVEMKNQKPCYKEDRLFAQSMLAGT